MVVPTAVEETFSDFRTTAGILFPFKVVSSKDGKKVSEGTITEVKVNTGVDDNLFVKPQ